MKNINLKVITILIALLLIFLLGISIIPKNITGNVVEEFEYSYTKAICNEDNLCQDYEIVCKGNQLKSQTPITGAIIQNPKNWTDSRKTKPLC